MAVDEDDKPIGFAMLDEIDQWLYLDELGVLPECGRRGIGTALVQHVCQLAQAAGYPAYWTDPFNRVFSQVV